MENTSCLIIEKHLYLCKKKVYLTFDPFKVFDKQINMDQLIQEIHSKVNDKQSNRKLSAIEILKQMKTL